MADSDHVVRADLRCDGNVTGEVEMHWKWDKFEKWHQVVWCHKWYMEYQHESVVIRSVDV